jgi:hypothetical protein
MDKINTFISGKIPEKFSQKKVSRAHIIAVAIMSGLFGAYLVFNSFAAENQEANLWVDTDGGSCVRQATPASYNDSQACGSFSVAYEAASAGDTVMVKSGTYGNQTLANLPPKSTDDYIVIRAESGGAVNIGYMKVDNTDNVEVRDMNTNGWGVVSSSDRVVYRNLKVLNLQNGGNISGSTNVSIIGGEIGFIDPNDGIHLNTVDATKQNTNILIDGLYMHDLTRNTDPDSHDDCVQVGSAENLTIRNSIFVNCGTQGVFLNPYGAGQVSNIVVENNWFGPAQLGFYSLIIGDVDNVLIRNNSFTQSPRVKEEASNVKLIGNIVSNWAAFNCSVTTGQSVEFSYNITNETCSGATNHTVNANLSNQYVNSSSASSSAFDLHLKPEATAIGKAKPGDFPSTDIDGDERPQGGAADAGADEYESTSSGVVANLWVDTNGGSCVRQATPSIYDDAQACGSFDAAWDAASAGDTIRVISATYSGQTVSGDKANETKIIAENGTTLTGAMIAQGDYMTLENVTINVGNTHGQSSGSNITGTNVIFKDVNLWGAFVSMQVNGSDFTWQGGTLGQNGTIGGERRCSEGDGQPVWINGDGTTIDSIRFNPQQASLNAPECGPDSTFHLENIRVQGADDVTVKNSWFLSGSDAGSGHVFLTTTSPSSPDQVTNFKLLNNVMEPVNGSYALQQHSNVQSCATYVFAYNTLHQDTLLGCGTKTGMQWIGNLGVKPSAACNGTYTRNVWQHNVNTACGSDTWVNGPAYSVSNLGINADKRHLNTGSPAINAGETNTASDFCTGTLGSIDFEGDLRPVGSACDAGADETTNGGEDPSDPAPDPSDSFGRDSIGEIMNNMSSDRKRVSHFTLNEDQTITHLSAYIDGNGSASSGTQDIRYVVYSDNNGEPDNLLGATEVHTINKGDSASWVQLTLTSPVELDAGTYHLGLHTGNTNSVGRYSAVNLSGGMKQNDDVFSDGSTNTFGSVDTFDFGLSIYATFGDSSDPPPDTDTTDPTISFTSPSNSETVSGIVTANVAASDNVGVDRVEFSLDGDLKLTDSESPYNYSFDSKTLSNGDHTVSAKAYDAAGNTKTASITVDVQNPDTTAPEAPTNLSATAMDPTTVNLSWSASTDAGSNATGVVKYNVLRNGLVIAQPTSTSYTDSDLTANTNYSYTVQAVDGADNTSTDSNTANVTTPEAPDETTPSIPGDLEAVAVNSSQVNLSWTASTDEGGSGLAGYNIYRNGNKLNDSLVTTTSYGDSSVNYDTSYSYEVEAVDGAGNVSLKTDPVMVDTPQAKRGDLTGPAGTPDGKIDLRDISYVIRNYNTDNTTADISGPGGEPDGVVDLRDISYLIRNYEG